jgi:hypothetical protein
VLTQRTKLNTAYPTVLSFLIELAV